MQLMLQFGALSLAFGALHNQPINFMLTILFKINRLSNQSTIRRFMTVRVYAFGF